jgi:xylulokinase
MYFLGLDIGTSGVKAVLVNRKGDVKASVTEPLGVSTPHPGWAEQHPDDWWKASVGAIKRVLTKARVEGPQVASLGLSGQMHSSVFLDASGKVIRPALLWCDGRTTDQCREITRRAGGEGKLKDWASNPALEGFTLPKVLWLKQHEPGAFRRLDKVCLPKDYIRYKLTGALATDPSDASATLMYDTAHLRWSEPMMKSVGLALHLLPSVGGSSEVLGYVTAAVAKLTGLPEGLPCAGGGADNACGAVGVGLVAPGDVVASWGTSGTVLAPTSRPKVDSTLRAHTFCHAVPDTWYLMGVILTAGGAFGWHKKEFAKELGVRRNGQELGDANEMLNSEASRIPAGAQGLTFLPYLQGERTPHRDASARGALVGLTLAHARAHVTRAVIEGICFGLRDSVEIIQGMKLPVKKVLLTGGGAKAPFVRQLQRDIYGLPVATVNREEGPAYGAALLGAVSVKAWKDIPSACKATLKTSAVSKPNLKMHRAYEAPYQKFKALYPALKGKF